MLQLKLAFESTKLLLVPVYSFHTGEYLGENVGNDKLTLEIYL